MTDPNTDWAQPEGAAPGPVAVPVTRSAGAAPDPAVTPNPLVKPRKKGGGLTNALLLVAVVVAVGGVTFAIGRATAPASASSVSSRTGTGLAGQGAGMPGGSFDPAQGVPAGRGGFGDRTMTVSGTVASIDGTTMAITTADGTSMSIDVSGSTYHAQTAATAGDVTSGTSVTVAVEGFGGLGRLDASAAPDASAAAGATSPTVTATDVTITSE